MRICSPHCGIDPETTSGGETYERELLRHLALGGMSIEILLARHKRYPDGVPNWTIRRLPISRGLRWPITPFVMTPAIKRAWDARPFDLLRAHSLRYVGPATLAARRRYRLDVPIVAHHHHLDPNPLNRFIEGPVMRAVDRVVVGSGFAVRQAGEDLGVPAERFAIAPYGVDDRFRPAPKPTALLRAHGLEGKSVVLFLGGLKSRKNLFLLIDVWRRVVAERDAARLVIVGTGPLLERLRAHAGALARDGRVVFTGYVPEADKVDYYNVADVLLFPSALEGFGFTVAEAMSCELPVVVSARGSLPEIVVDGEGGFLCDPERPDTFVERVLQLLADPMLRRKFGRANRERVDRLYRWNHCAETTAKVYAEVVEGWRHRRAQAR